MRPAPITTPAVSMKERNKTSATILRVSTLKSSKSKQSASFVFWSLHRDEHFVKIRLFPSNKSQA